MEVLLARPLAPLVALTVAVAVPLVLRLLSAPPTASRASASSVPSELLSAASACVNGLDGEAGAGAGGAVRGSVAVNGGRVGELEAVVVAGGDVAVIDVVVIMPSPATGLLPFSSTWKRCTLLPV